MKPMNECTQKILQNLNVLKSVYVKWEDSSNRLINSSMREGNSVQTTVNRPRRT